MRKSILAVIAAITAIATAEAAQYSKEDIAREASKVKIDNVIDLPIRGMRAVESNGQIMFISTDGRFAFKGKMYDIWNQSQYTSVSEIKANAFKVSLDKMRIDPTTLNTVTIGDGPKETVIFLDPRCPYCHKLAKQTLALIDEYTFHFVFVSLLGPESEKNVAQVACAKNKEEVIPAMLSRSLDQIDLVPMNKCDTSKIVKSTTTSQILGISGVPYTISPNGTVQQGMPRNLKNWLSAN